MGKRSKKEIRNIELSESRKSEIEDQISNGSFIPWDRRKIPEGARIFGSKFIEVIKKVENETHIKIRLVAQNYSIEEASKIATKAPTIQRFSQRMFLSLSALEPGMDNFKREVTHTYIQEKTALERDVYISAPEEIKLPDNTIFKVIIPLYFIPESVLLLYLTYLDHHVDHLGMRRANDNPCLLWKRNDT